MSESLTPRLGLSKPNPGTGEPVNVAKLNANFDKIDASSLYSPAANELATDGTLRVRATGDLSLTSTGHGFQVGPDNSLNIAIDGNEIQARSNGGPNTLLLQTDSGGTQFNGNATDPTANTVTLNANLAVNGIGQRRTFYKTTDQSATNSSTLVNATNLGASVVANAVYTVDLMAIYEATVANDMKIAFTFPAGANFPWGLHSLQSAAPDTIDDFQSFAFGDPASDAPFNVGGGGAGLQLMLTVKGTLMMGATAGTLQFRFAQVSAAASTSAIIKSGSRMTIERIA